MKLKVVLFDLDGTLLPMEFESFIKSYFTSLGKALSLHGYEANTLMKAVLKGTDAMVKNDGKKTNEEVFWDTFSSAYGRDARRDEPLFARYYEEDFDSVKAATTPTARSAEAVSKIKALGLRVALATNPVFPAIATQKRLAWAGLSPDDFEFYTTYENSSYCKPNPKYYESLLPHLSVSPEECLMVGNDAIEDMAAEKAGMKVFLLTDCLINRDERELSAYPQGGFDELFAYVRTLI